MAEDSRAAQLAGMSRLARVSVLVTLVLAAACAGSEAAQAGGSGTTAVAPAAAPARPALPAVIDSIAAESLAVDSALRGLTGDPDHAIFGCFVLDTAVYADTRLDTFGEPPSDHRASGAYRRRVAPELVLRAVRAATQRASP